MNKKNYIMIKDNSALKELVDHLLKENIIAVDTESNGLHAYQERICLVQISTKTKNYIVDPFEADDLSPLGKILESKKTEKVFHSGEYDLICLWRDYGFRFNNLFDTMIAAKLVGNNKLGLGGVVEEELKIHIPKKFQKSDWGQRPLPDEMLDYAMTDTLYLIRLRDILKKKLELAGLLPLAAEEFDMLSTPLEIAHPTSEDIFWKLSRSTSLSRRGNSVIWKLILMRDEEARRRDRPLFKIFSDKLILSIAEELPTKREELASLKGMGRYNMQNYSGRILSIVKSKIDPVPKKEKFNPPSNPGFRYRLDKLQRWRIRAARKAKLSSEFIMPRQLMYDFAESPPLDPEDLKRKMERFPYRYEKYVSEWGFPLIKSLEKVGEKLIKE